MEFLMRCHIQLQLLFIHVYGLIASLTLLLATLIGLELSQVLLEGFITIQQQEAPAKQIQPTVIQALQVQLMQLQELIDGEECKRLLLIISLTLKFNG
jgi:hypothetical protein